MNKKKLPVVIAIGVVLASNLADASVNTVVEASQNMEDITSNDAVITSVDIEQRGFKTIIHALKTVSGLEMTRSGGGRTNITFRGIEGNVLVLLDGVRLNDPEDDRGADFSGVSIRNITRIEIIKEPRSDLGVAVAGVINIFTKKADRDGFNTSLNLEYGSFNTKTIGLTSNFKQDAFYASIALSKQKTDGFSKSTALGKRASRFEDDWHEEQAINLRLGYNLNKNNRVEVFYGYTETDEASDSTIRRDKDGNRISRDDPRRAVLKANNSNSFRGREVVSYGINYRNTYKNITSKFSVDRIDISRYSKEIDLQDKIENDDLTGTVDNIKLSSSISYNSKDLVVVGVDYKTENYHRIEVETGEEDNIRKTKRKTARASITNSNTFNIIKNDSTIFKQAFRFNDYSDHKNNSTYKIGLKHNFNDFNNLSLSANYGIAYRLPSLSGRSSASHLDPQKTKSFDFTVHFDNLEVTYFNDKITNTFERLRDPFRIVNLPGESVRQGVEINYTMGLAIIDTEVSVSYTYTDARKPDKARFLRVPYHKASILFDYEGIDDFTMGARIEFRDETLQRNRSVEWDDPNRFTTLPMHASVDLTAAYQLFDNQLNIYGRIENVFDNETPTRINSGVAERSYYLGIRYNFN